MSGAIKMITTVNPATGAKLSDYPLMASSEIASIVAKVEQAYIRDWHGMNVEARLPLLRQLARVLRDGHRYYAELITQEMGKPVKEAEAEVEKCAWTADIYAEKALAWLAEEKLSADGQEHQVVFQPMGTVLAVMPWNFPFWQVFRFAIPTMTVGNTTILKHSNVVPGCALAIEEIFRKAGFPEDVFRTIIADHKSTERIVHEPSIVGVSLTGSTQAGSKIASLAGDYPKKIVLELGGSDPFIVLADADVEFAASQAVLSRFQNAGQSCIAAKRIIVEEKVSEAFKRAFIAGVQAKKVGDPMDVTTDIGPLANDRALALLNEQVKNAIGLGAIIDVGGKRLERPGYFYEPTVLSQITSAMQVYQEEVFGPVAPLIVVKDEAEALKTANDTIFGLGASVWTKDLARGKKIALQLQAGTTFVNSIVKSDARIPFGGTKASGLGRELSHYGMREFANLKAINIYPHRSK